MTDKPVSDGIWQRAEIDSPCVKICVVHPETRLCIGCKRTMDEITAWSHMSPVARRAVMEELPGRVASPGRRGGRAGRRLS